MHVCNGLRELGESPCVECQRPQQLPSVVLEMHSGIIMIIYMYVCMRVVVLLIKTFTHWQISVSANIVWVLLTEQRG